MSRELAYVFRHQLLRDAAYELLVPSARAQLHRQALDSFEKLFPQDLDRHAEELADHATAAILQGDTSRAVQEQEYKYLQLAAEYNASQYRLDAELACTRRLASHPLAKVSDKARHATRVAKLLLAVGNPASAEQAADEALGLAQSAGLTAEEHQAMLLRYRARAERGVAAPEELPGLVRELKPHGPTEPLMQGYIEQAVILARAGDYNAAVSKCERAREIAQQLGDSAGESESLQQMALHLHYGGRSPEAEQRINEALSIALKTGNRVTEMEARNISGIIYVETRRATLAAEAYRAAVALAKATSSRANEITILGNLANLDFLIFGRLSAAETQYLKSLEFLTERGELGALTHANGMLGRIYLAAGEWARARQRLNAVLELAGRVGHKPRVARALMFLAQCRTPRSVRDAVAEYVRAFTEMHEFGWKSEIAENWSLLAEELFDAGLIVAAADALERAQPSADSPPPLAAQAEVVRQALLLGNFEVAAVAAQSLKATQGTPNAQTRLPVVMFPQFLVASCLGASGDTLAVERCQTLLHEMSALADTFECNRYFRSRVALESARQTSTLLHKSPQLLWAGLPPRVLTPQLRHALVARAAALKTGHNPELLEVMAEGAIAPELPWDTPLADLPGVHDFKVQDD
jgi:tetratricopeptide (TPR) repeat protein